MIKKLFLILLAACYALAYEDTDNSNVSIEVGIGYLNSTFTGKQRGFSGKGSARGVDIFVAANVYADERFGLQLGMGAEFLNGGWNDECRSAGGNGMGAYSYSYTREVLNFYLAKTNNNKQSYKDELAEIKKAAGDNYNNAFDASKPFNTALTGSQGYLYKSPETGENVLKRFQYENTYTEVGSGKGDYEKNGDGYIYVGSGKGTHTKTSDYVYVTSGGTEKKDYVEKTDTDGSVTGVKDKKYYEQVAEGTGTHSRVEEEYYWYRYNGSIIDGTGLSCSTPKLDVKTWYLFLGAFYDVLKFEHFAVRAFGNVGVGYDMMKDRYNRATSFYDGGSYEMFYTYNSNESPSQEQGSVFMPLTAGLRFIIAKNHGIEFVGKYNLIKSKWKGTQTLYDGTYNGKDMPQAIRIDTKITRDYSWGIRYVYEFRND